MNKQKGISSLAGIVIVLLVAVLVVGGILAYQYWWMPKEEVEKPEIEAEKPKMEKPEVEKPETEKPKVEEQQRIFNSKEECDVAGVECVAEIKDGTDTGRYIRVGMVLEGENFMMDLLGDISNPSRCCAKGLKAMDDMIISVDGTQCIGPPECPCYICLKCGDGNCGLGENWCNCPEDCPK